MATNMNVRVHWNWKCFDPNGNLKWNEEYDNLVVNTGLNYALDAALSGGTPITSWFIGLIDGATPTLAAGDTTASHGGWTENENYSQATRVAWVEAGVSAQSITNAASPAVFSIDTDAQTIGGGFLVSLNTKGGTTGTLFSEGAFATARTADDGDTINVTVAIGAADDGI